MQLLLAMAIAAATPDPPQVVRIAELEIDLTALDRYKAVLATEIEASVRLEPGVIALQAVSLKDQPNHVRILEVYADQAAYAAHLKAPHFLTYKQATAAMVRSLTLHETSPILLCAKADPATCRKGD